MRLQNKICAITGAGGGIGLAAAKCFSEEGAFVYLLEVAESQGKTAENSILEAGGKACFLHCDVSDDDSVQAAFAKIAAEHGRLDVLYNNASVYLGGQDGPLTEIAPATWRRVLAINLDSIYHCCRHAIPLMKKNGGSIINTASSAGVIGIPKCDAYTASKGATVALTRSMAVEYGKFAIRCNCIAPAAIATKMISQSNPDGPDFDSETFVKIRTPLRRFGTPEEVAKLALFLASDDSAYINGTVIAADGGITICGDLAKPDSDRQEIANAKK
jgi:NAD(P)-dependent dehydrogenase (short-subunit alcohol dehydrogenase family)